MNCHLNADKIKNVTGIVTEFNPLHAGHVRLFREIRRILGADTAIICAMSGDFVQRGDMAVIRRQARAEAAIFSGADLVIELPLPWAVSSAERFAEGGVSLLLATGLIDTLAFGSESGDLSAIRKAAALMPRDNFQAALRDALSAGISYPAARQRALEKLSDEKTADILSRPNDLLGVEYCKAILKYNNNFNININILPVRRDSFHDQTGSASEIRALLRTKDAKNHDAALNLMAPAMREYYLREEAAGRAPVFYETLERAILARLKSMTRDEFALYDAGHEGLYNRLYQAVQESISIQEILERAKTKRYPMARLRRMILHACLNLPQNPRFSTDCHENANNNIKIPFIRPLAMNRTGRILLARMRKTAKILILSKIGDIKKLNPEAQVILKQEIKAANLYALAFPDFKSQDAKNLMLTQPPKFLDM